MTRREDPVPGRRAFLKRAGLGVASATALVLRADARPTPVIARGGEGRVEVLLGEIPPPAAAPAPLHATTPLPYGPAYRAGAPFRGKLSLPGEAGTPFVLRGRVWELESRAPLPGAVLDFWHVDASGHYSDGVSDLRNRGRLLTSETGAYELESVRPVPYEPSPGSGYWRCAHFHVLVRSPGRAPLVTEIHFRDEPHKEDGMYTPANAIAVEAVERNGLRFETAEFDFVLRRE